MLQHTRGIVLRSIKYGETSLVSNIFTESFGVQSYLVQGVRTVKSKSNKTGLLQPATLLELVAWQKPQKNLQRLREFQSAYIYTSLQEEVVKNSIALFSVEILLRLLPADAPAPELFDLSFSYFKTLDQLPVSQTANFPLYFMICCCNFLGFELKGSYSEQTPHLHLQEGGYAEHPPMTQPFVPDEDARKLGELLQVKDLSDLGDVEMNAPQRNRLIHWYISFLQTHTQHLGQIRSLTVLQAVLH